MNFETPKTVLFDLDGTLADNYDAITKTAAYALEKLNLKPPTREQIKAAVGGSIMLTMQRLIGDKLAETAAKIYAEKADEYATFGLKAMPGARELLERLRDMGVRAACFTNKDEKVAKKVLSYLKLDGLLEAVIGTSLKGPRKPMPEFTLAALEKLNTKPCDALIIGDSKFDYLAAKNCSIRAILVATGNDSVKDLEAKCPDAFAICQNMDQIRREFFAQ